jgi:hypothetical protein
VIERSARARSKRYVHGVVVLSVKDAFMLCEHLNLPVVQSAYSGRSEEIIGSLLALAQASEDFQTYVNAREQAGRPQEVRTLLNCTTPARIARELGINPAAVRQALADGRLKGNKDDGRWRIAPADDMAYRAARRRRT